MRLSKLYILLILSVLISGCEPEESDKRQGERSENAPDSTEGDSSNAASRGVILFLGNSLSAGLGVDSNESFPSRIQQRIDSLGWGFQVVNAGLSGETTAGGLRRIDWLLRQPVSVLVLELGGNDGLRGVPVEVTRRNLQEMIRKTRTRYPDAEIILAGMQIPPNLGHDYTQRFRQIYPELADETDSYLIPFLLEDVGTVDSLMQNDGIHPTAQGHRLVAENVWAVLRPVLEELRPTS